MTKNNKLAKGIAAALLLAGTGSAMAETLTVPATVSVNNAIDFQFTGSLDFGTATCRATKVSSTYRCKLSKSIV